MPFRSLDARVYFNVDIVFLRGDGTRVPVGIGAIWVVGIVEIQDHGASFGFGDVHESARAVGAHPRSFIHERKE